MSTCLPLHERSDRYAKFTAAKTMNVMYLERRPVNHGKPVPIRNQFLFLLAKIINTHKQKMHKTISGSAENYFRRFMKANHAADVLLIVFLCYFVSLGLFLHAGWSQTYQKPVQ